MAATTALCDALAELFEYPREGHAARMRELARRIAAGSSEAGADVEGLARFAAERTLGECEELYVHTFDANAERALEVGWQVFGEQYERGAFLVDLRGRMRALGVAETTELPDHLTQVLRVLGRMDEAEARTLVARAVTPCLSRVRGHLDAGNPYLGALDAVARVLGCTAAAASSAPSGGER